MQSPLPPIDPVPAETRRYLRLENVPHAQAPRRPRPSFQRWLRLLIDAPRPPPAAIRSGGWLRRDQ